MTATIYTLDINNYMPEVTKITFPLMKKYAEKCNGKFHIINSNFYRSYPVAMNKFLIKNISVQMNDEWSIFIDADALIHPDMPDITKMLRKDTLAMYGFDQASLRFTMDDYFTRDGRNLSSCGWFIVCSNLLIEDLWKFPDESFIELFPKIKVLEAERELIGPDHLMDEYVLSHNIARFGLKTATLHDNGFKPYLHHMYNVPYEKKLELIKNKLKEWNLDT